MPGPWRLGVCSAGRGELSVCLGTSPVGIFGAEVGRVGGAGAAWRRDRSQGQGHMRWAPWNLAEHEVLEKPRPQFWACLEAIGPAQDPPRPAPADNVGCTRPRGPAAGLPKAGCGLQDSPSTSCGQLRPRPGLTWVGPGRSHGQGVPSPVAWGPCPWGVSTWLTSSHELVTRRHTNPVSYPRPGEWLLHEPPDPEHHGGDTRY